MYKTTLVFINHLNFSFGDAKYTKRRERRQPSTCTSLIRTWLSNDVMNALEKDKETEKSSAQAKFSKGRESAA